MIVKTRGAARLDTETRRKKQQALMIKMVERKVRSRAQQLYESRGQTEGQELQDWFQAESEVLDNTVVGPLYRRMRTSVPNESSDPGDAPH
jgi:Protein of unknown function (DUF2934)